MAQLGSARRSGRRGRRFKSCYPDCNEKRVAIDGDAEVSYESLCGACYLDESGGVLNRGWRPKLDFSATSGPDADFT